MLIFWKVVKITVSVNYIQFMHDAAYRSLYVSMAKSIRKSLCIVAIDPSSLCVIDRHESPPDQSSIVTRTQRSNQLIMVMGVREQTVVRAQRPRMERVLLPSMSSI